MMRFFLEKNSEANCVVLELLVGAVYNDGWLDTQMEHYGSLH